MREFIRVMKAVSDPNRVKILKMLQHRTLCVCELQAALGIAQPTVSKHLKILEEAGLVIFRKEGLWVNYQLSDGSSRAYSASILGSLRHWLENDNEVIVIMNKLPSINREVICRRL